MKGKAWSILCTIIALLAWVSCTPISRAPGGQEGATPTPPVGTLPVKGVQGPEKGEPGEQEPAATLIELARADLAQRQGVDVGQIFVQSVEQTAFRDASLGVPDPGQTYAQVVTPGYVIRVIVGGKVYRYHGSGDRVVLAPTEQPVTGPTPRDGAVVTVFFGNSLLSPAGDCNVVFPVERQVSAAGDLSRAALQQLFAGPTEEEKAQGYTSLFSQATKDILQGLKVEGNTAYVNLADVRWLIPAASSSCGGASFFAAIRSTLAQVSPVERVIYAIDGNPALFYEWAQIGCDRTDDRCDPAPFQETANEPSAAPPAAVDPLLSLPENAMVVSRVSADLNGDGTAQEVVLAGFGGVPQMLSYNFLQLFVLEPGAGGEYAVAWQSGQLIGERGEALQVQDVNGDGRLEVLSVQSMGAAGQTMYVAAWDGAGYGLLVPQGGHFEGWSSFGENAVRTEDADGDGLVEILASYGPAASQTDVYRWDGQGYAYERTLGEGASVPADPEPALASQAGAM